MSKITKPSNGVDVLDGAYTVYGDTGLCWSNKSNRFVGAKHSGYLAVKHNNEKYLVHRLMAHAYLGLALDSGRSVQVDHINGDKLDNRICNLQVLTASDHALKTHLGKQNADYSHITAEQIKVEVSSQGWLPAAASLGVSSPAVLKNLYRTLTGEDPRNIQKGIESALPLTLQIPMDFQNCWISTTL